MKHFQLLMLSTFITTLTFAAHKEKSAAAKSKQSKETTVQDCTQTVKQTRDVSYTCNGVDITVSATASYTMTASDCTSATVGATVAAGIKAQDAATKAATAGAAACQPA